MFGRRTAGDGKHLQGRVYGQPLSYTAASESAAKAVGAEAATDDEYGDGEEDGEAAEHGRRRRGQHGCGGRGAEIVVRVN